MREPVVNGIRLGFGIALIGILAGRNKNLEQRVLGFLVMQSFQRFDMLSHVFSIIITVYSISIYSNKYNYI
jgi:ABC-type nitrate/sulfonate/bicarbonate transport system permease component